VSLFTPRIGGARLVCRAPRLLPIITGRAGDDEAHARD
jgi:hypothetical protein